MKLSAAPRVYLLEGWRRQVRPACELQRYTPLSAGCRCPEQCNQPELVPASPSVLSGTEPVASEVRGSPKNPAKPRGGDPPELTAGEGGGRAAAARLHSACPPLGHAH